MGQPIIEYPTEDPEPFPESDADLVLEQARYLDTLALGAVVQLGPLLTAPGAVAGIAAASNEEAMVRLLSDIKKLLGDYTDVRDIALDWADVSNVPMDIREDLRDRVGVLDDYWEGVAFDSFKGHLDQTNEALKDTHNKIVTIAKTLAGAISLVFDTWAAAIKFLASCATALVGVWNPDKILGALKELAGNISTLVSDAIKTMGNYVEDLTSLKIDAVTFPTLPDNPETLDSAGNTDGWEVKPAPGT